ncbi:MAG: prolipoprotein diacylglyceryl transferase [Pseudomonadota bacterium]
MHPVILRIGDITLYSYGLFVGLGFLSAVWFSSRRAKVFGFTPEFVTDLFFVILVSGILGARIAYVLQNFLVYAADPLSIFKIWTGGLVFYGGFLCALVCTMIYVVRRGFRLWHTADFLAPAIALGHAVGRIGCFFAGCCYGQECDLPWGITFSDPDSLAPLGVMLHPTQLYSVATNLCLCLFLLWLEKRKRFSGMVFWVYILLYGTQRFLVEVFRGDPRGFFLVNWLSFSQGIGVIMVVIALAMLVYLNGRGHDRT